MEIVTKKQGRNVLVNLFAGKTGVELGTERGKFAEKIAEVAEKLYVVDLWKSYGEYRTHVDDSYYEEIYEDCKRRLSRYDVGFVRDDIDSAAKIFADESMQFIYLDGNHEYEHVRRNLETWWRVLVPDGIMSGHDITGRHGKGVKKAVMEFAAEKGIDEIVIWDGDSSGSYHFVKP